MHPLLLLQAVPDSFTPTQFLNLGVGGAVALVMFLVYRADRKSAEERFEEYAARTEKRYEEIAKDFRMIITENTAANVKLTAVIDQVLRERA